MPCLLPSRSVSEGSICEYVEMHDVVQGNISPDRIAAVPRPRRICFASTHRNALVRTDHGTHVGKFSVPFRESFYPIFYELTGIELVESRNSRKYWRFLTDEDEYQKIERFIREERSTVFLRDTLGLSVALSEYMDAERKRTEVGELEYRAKYLGDLKCTGQLACHCLAAVDRLPFYRQSRVLCAVPPSDNSSASLQRRIATIVTARAGIRDVSASLAWRNTKPELKRVPLEQKWERLQNTGLSVDLELDGESVILLDDLYQSGITIQYVGRKLLDAGASVIYGLTLVKSRGDADNVGGD